jgi:hypothetical protein
VVTAAGLHVGPGVGVRDDFRALRSEVAVAQPAVVLAAGVDDPLHRLVGDLLDRRVDLLRALDAGAAVDQQRAGRRDHQADVGVQAFVFVGAAGLFTDEGIEARGDRLELHFDGVGQRGGTDPERAETEAKGRAGHGWAPGAVKYQ